MLKLVVLIAPFLAIIDLGLMVIDSLRAEKTRRFRQAIGTIAFVAAAFFVAQMVLMFVWTAPVGFICWIVIGAIYFKLAARLPKTNTIV